jgi:sec-independent protein translocase protein TatA
MMPNGWEIIVILAVLVLLFGASKIPELARAVGTSIRELRRGLSDEDKDPPK